MNNSKILDFFRQYNSPVKLKKIYRKFKSLPREEITAVINELVDKGNLIKISKEKYIVTKQENVIVGKLSLQRGGYGFVDPIEGGKGIFIKAKYIGYALHGDMVSCIILKGGEKAYGKIVKIIERGIHKIVGRVIKKDKKFYVKPEDLRVSIEFKLDIKDIFKVKTGDYVVLNIKFDQSPFKLPSVQVIENLGQQGSHLDMELIIRKYDLITNFPDNISKELNTINDYISEKEIGKRMDLRDQLCFTIDGEDARDFDDAVAIQKLKNNRYRLFVHIADVSHYVKLNSELNLIAYKKATSVYFPNNVFPMLPEKLSNGVCSLKPFQDRLTITCEMVVNSLGKTEKYKIYKSVINSKARLTYKLAQKIIDNKPDARNKYPYVVNALIEMEKLSHILNKKRFKRGSIDFDMPEPKLILDANDVPIKIIKSERWQTHKIIESFMILANETVAEFIYKKNIPSIYRVHEPPQTEKVKDLLNLLQMLRIKPPKMKKITPMLFQKIAELSKDRPEESLINFLMIRTMSIAKYSKENIGHFGLASKCYTHFTSPIRRYADLFIHRTLKLLLENKYNKKKIKYWDKKLDEICTHITDKSIKAQEAERDVVELKQMQFIDKEVGNIFEGIITKINERELFIELVDTLIRGFVPLSELKDDYYIADEKRFKVVGKRRKKIFKIGDRLIVKLIQVEIKNRRAKFKFIRKVNPIHYS